MRNFWIKSRTTENGFAKGGLNLTESSISTNRSECFFHETKLQKKCEVEKQARLNATNLSTWFQPRLLQILCYLQFLLESVSKGET
jgi:hypothetical protein